MLLLAAAAGLREVQRLREDEDQRYRREHTPVAADAWRQEKRSDEIGERDAIATLPREERPARKEAHENASWRFRLVSNPATAFTSATPDDKQ